ncbi:uncharacterized protein [Aegilops tauschii subsp. strangulata]|uniref:uncharacterized protein isoform X2 n=1 Tax=Aegilops tauschii subsp. strangulata TaxID=200361 RepID=UPI001E1CAF85|nr:uncharacterized protein LOC109767763 isoform X2 [Aegilops tauschii subsp. strangulata]
MPPGELIFLFLISFLAVLEGSLVSASGVSQRGLSAICRCLLVWPVHPLICAILLHLRPFLVTCRTRFFLPRTIPSDLCFASAAGGCASHAPPVLCDLKATDDSISISAWRELFSTMPMTGKGKIQSAVPPMNKVMQINILLCLCYEVA